LIFEHLTGAGVVELEPALEPLEKDLAGGLYNALDETGDAYRFCVALADVCRRQGVQFRFGTTIASIEVRSGAVAAIQGEGKRWVADRYLIETDSAYAI
jgi:D-amino-acid dehydrogenase